jgi:hypothetical protein
MSATLEMAKPKAISALRSESSETVLGLAYKLLAHRPSWAEFHREIFGLDGAMRKLYRTPDELARFKETPAFEELLSIVASLRKGKGCKDYGPSEPTRVITLRIPKSLHETLLEDAHEGRTSMNQLCITKLLGLEPGQ